MHAEKRRRRWLIPALLAAAGLLAAAAAAAFVVLTRAPKPMDRALASAAAPKGGVRGLWLTQELPTAAGTLSDSGPEALDALFADAADYAAAHGLNALLLDVAGSRLSGVAFRGTIYETWPGAAAGDTFQKKYDPLRALCETASARGLSVYAVTPALSGSEDWNGALAKARELYAVAGVWTRADGLGDESGAPVLVANEALFLDPSRFFLDVMEGGAANGVVFDYAQCLARPGAFSLLSSALASPGAPPDLLNGYTPAPTLSISYPADGAAIYTKQCFVMGTSDPAQPLYLNGTLVETRAPGGTFGVLMDVDPAGTVYTAAQGDQSVSVSISRSGSGAGGGGGGGGGGASSSDGHDATQRVAPGTMIRTTGWITSLLYEPSSDGNINETVRAGATAKVVSCTETMRSGMRTWAYQLESGDYVLAYNTELADGAPMAFTGAAAVPTETGETLTFTGSGTPLAYTNIVAGRLEMDFYDAQFAPDFAVTGSSMVTGTTVTANADGSTRVTLTFAEPIWGHTLEYADGTTQVLLKKAPVRSDVFGKPLTGVRVLLDAGHGDHDGGAMGAAGYDAPVEKDVNLAVTLAVKYRLEQLGATVQTIRTDDSFLSLADRNRAITEGQPDFFIALHHNSVNLNVDANKQSGAECYYFYSAGKTLAETLVNNVSAAADRPNRGAMWGYYYVTRNTTCPAVLLEIGFMVNPAEYELVTKESMIWREAAAVAESILTCVPDF